jgi:DegV family protein with EDD domain
MDQPMRRRVAIVTDSAAYLPPALVEAYAIDVVPAYVTMGDRTWRDGVDIDPPAFYELLRTSADFPTTSHANPADFRAVFDRLSSQVEGVVAVLVTEKLSGMAASARLAAADLAGFPIAVIDSQGVSMSQGFVVLAAARAAAAGGDLEAVIAAAHELIGKTYLYFIVGTLEYLHRGGRIGTVVRLLGSALDLKPILEMRDGVIKPIHSVRTRKKALIRIYELIQKAVPPGGRVHMAVINVAAPQEAAEFQQELAARFQPVEMLAVECSPAIGAHGGPGTVAVAFYVE